MCIKIGFLTDVYCTSELANNICDFIGELSASEKRYNWDVVVFANNLVKPQRMPACSIVPMKYLLEFRGIAIATDIESALDMIECPVIDRMFYYLSSIDWYFKPYINYNEYAKVYQNDAINFIFPSYYYKNVFESAWGKRKNKFVWPKIAVPYLMKVL